MSTNDNDWLTLLDLERMRTEAEDRALADGCSRAIAEYRAAVVNGQASPEQTQRARRAFLHLGGDPARSSFSLKDYDHERFGPFLGVSDEGSAGAAIRAAGMESPKARMLPKDVTCRPLAVGLAIDAERLCAAGEVNVGPEEYVDIWLEAVERLLVTTNVGTRVNLRVYQREPTVLLKGDGQKELDEAKQEIAAAFKPFVETPDLKPRPLTVFVDIPNYVRMTGPKRRSALKKLVDYVSSGKAAGKDVAPAGQELGLATWVKLGSAGRDQAIAAIELAAKVGMRVVLIDGVKRKAAEKAVSLAGLLDYFPPGCVGPILRAAKSRNVCVRTANLPDTDTIARSTWVGLTTARSNGVNLGKYGCFPLTLEETDYVVEQIQKWLGQWSAAPVFFVDQGVLSEDGVDVGHDLMRGLKRWLTKVAAHKVRIVLIDTVDKGSGKRLLKRSTKDDAGFVTLTQVKTVEAFARSLGIRLLWAGGLRLPEAFEMGRLGVFGIYVTSAAATTVPVSGSYIRDPCLAGVKEPSKEAVLRTKIVLEAGFLSSHLTGEAAVEIDRLAKDLLTAHDKKAVETVKNLTEALASACAKGWRTYWDKPQPGGSATVA